MPPRGDDGPVSQSQIGARPVQELELEAPGREAKQPEFMEVFEQEQPHPHGADVDCYDDFPSPPARIDSFDVADLFLQLDRCDDTLRPLAGDGTGPCKDLEMEVSTTITEPEYISVSPQTALAPPAPAAGEGAGATSGGEETELAGIQTPTTVRPLRPCTDAEMEVDYSSLVDTLTSPAPVPSSVAGDGPSSPTSRLDKLSPTATDQEIMRHMEALRKVVRSYVIGKCEENISTRFHMSRFYLDPTSAKTPGGGGYWQEAKEPGAITAIRAYSSDSKYAGLRRLLEFVPEGNCKDKWLAHEYIMLEHLEDDKGGRRRAQIVEDVTIRKVFKQETRSLNLKRRRKTQDDSPVISSEPSDMWNYMTAIYVKSSSTNQPGSNKKKDNEDSLQMCYTICDRCDHVFKCHGRSLANQRNHLNKSCFKRNSGASEPGSSYRSVSHSVSVAA